MVKTICSHDVGEAADQSRVSQYSICTEFGEAWHKKCDIWTITYTWAKACELRLTMHSLAHPSRTLDLHADLIVPYGSPAEIPITTLEDFSAELFWQPCYYILSTSMQDEMHKWIKKIPAYLKICQLVHPGAYEVIKET